MEGKIFIHVFLKAAALAHSVILNHAFIDGNKRTGYMAMRLFLNVNGYDVKASLEERYKFVMEIAKKTRNEESIAEWLRGHSQKMKKTNY